MKNVLAGIFLVVSSAGVFSSPAMAQGRDMNEKDVRATLSKEGDFTQNEINAILDEYKKKTGGEVKVSGILTAWGWQSQLFASWGYYNMSLNYKDAQGDLKSLDNSLSCKYENHGLAIGFGVKFFFIFLPSGMKIRDLEGAVFGKGVGITLDVGIGVDVAWLPGNNRAGNAFLVAPQIGAGGGLTFPRLEFALGKDRF